MTKKRLTITSSPHIKSANTVSKVMLDVIIALTPAFIMSVIIFGPRVLLITAACVLSSLLFEFHCFKIFKRENTLGDLSAVVTGLIIALNLPVTVPIYIAIIGSFIAIVIVKQLFGGIGQNFANPAATARVILLITFAGQMTNWAAPFFYRAQDIVDVVSRATPLAEAGQSTYSFMDMFIGMRGGALGETCSIALIAGGIYLIARRVITGVIPAVYIGTVAVLSLVFKQNMAVNLMGGGLLLGAIFMATDYTTSPATLKGQAIFAAGCGFFTMIIRTYGGFPEGVSFSILLMNIISPLIDRYLYTTPSGSLRKKRKKGDVNV